VLIADPDKGGHHLHYVSLLIQGLREQGVRPVFASTDSTFASDEFRTFLAPLRETFTSYSLACSDGRGFRGALTKARWLMKVTARVPADVIVVPYVDDLFYPASAIGIARKLAGWAPPPMIGIMMHCNFVFPMPSMPLRRRLKGLACHALLRAGLWERMFLIDEVAHDYLRRLVPARVGLVHDPVEAPPSGSGEAMRRRLGIPAGARVVGAFGLLGEGKSVVELARAFVARPESPKEFLLLVGRQTEPVRQTLAPLLAAHPGHRVIALDRFVEHEELLASVAATDVVAAIYPCHFSSSSILLYAAAAGKAVLGSQAGWIGHTIKTYGLGRCCNPSRPAVMSAALAWALDEAQPSGVLASLLASRHSPQAFCKTVTQYILQQADRSRGKLSPEPALGASRCG
jgi:hypothetical protein